MATIGLKNLVYAPITEDNAGMETYGTPVSLAKAISVGLSVELNTGVLYADDIEAEEVSEFKSGKLTLGVSDIGTENAAALTGARIDANGVMISAKEDTAPHVAIGFAAPMSNGKDKYFWLYRVRFSVPAVNAETKSDSVKFSTPTIEGDVKRRNLADSEGGHPWKAEIVDGETTADAATIAAWFTEVYEPDTTMLSV